MKQTIYKYEVPLQDDFSLELPGGGERFLSFQVQGEKLVLWALVDLEKETRWRDFKIKGTGQDCDDLWQFEPLGTVQQGALAWHLFFRMTAREYVDPFFQTLRKLEES